MGSSNPSEVYVCEVYTPNDDGQQPRLITYALRRTLRGAEEQKRSYSLLFSNVDIRIKTELVKE